MRYQSGLPAEALAQAGQTLIETILATFILTSSLVAGLSLAIYVLNASNVSKSQVVATNLAREGVEVVRMMRDTNWLEGDAKGGDGFALDLDCGSNPPSGQNSSNENPMDGKACYPGWLVGPSGSGYHAYNISASNNANDYRLMFDPATKSWTLGSTSGGERFHICLQADGSYQHNSTCDSNPNPLFARRVRITETTTAAPFTPRNPKLKVESVVVWTGKRCTSIINVDPYTLSTPCKILIEEHLTNWKDYK